MKASLFPIVFFAVICWSCSTDAEPQEDDKPNETERYFPPLQSAEWETTSPTELGWNSDSEQELHNLLQAKGTKAFIILKNGKIAVEWYFGDFTQNTYWYWASAGKTLTAFTVGLAQQEGLLNITDKTSDHLGLGWTSLSPEKEELITIWHQLTMTSGMDDTQFDCVTSDCLEYVADAGTRWAYHNGPYTLLQKVVANAAKEDWDDYFKTNLSDRIGMDGFWLSTNNQNNVYFSTARSMARFGLLNLNNGIWQEDTILDDPSYVADMKNTSQPLNKSYGYLWWLNGKDSHMIPRLQTQFSGSMIPNAPSDTYAGLGKNDQKLYVVPSKNLVIVRMGEDASDGLLATSAFDNELWEKINLFID